MRHGRPAGYTVSEGCRIRPAGGRRGGMSDPHTHLSPALWACVSPAYRVKGGSRPFSKIPLPRLLCPFTLTPSQAGETGSETLPRETPCPFAPMTSFPHHPVPAPGPPGRERVPRGTQAAGLTLGAGRRPLGRRQGGSHAVAHLSGSPGGDGCSEPAAQGIHTQSQPRAQPSSSGRRVTQFRVHGASRVRRAPSWRGGEVRGCG